MPGSALSGFSPTRQLWSHDIDQFKSSSYCIKQFLFTIFLLYSTSDIPRRGNHLQTVAKHSSSVQVPAWLLLLLLMLIHTFSVLSLQLKKLRWHNKSVIDLSNANPACGHKEVRRSKGHIMVTTRYSDQQGSKPRQKVMRLYKQWHRPISKRFIIQIFL